MIKNANLLGRFALIGGADAYIYSAKTKDLETVFENCNNLELTAKGDKVDIKEKGAIVMSVAKPMSCTLKFTAETTSFDKLSMALGSAGFTKTTEVDTYQKNQMFRITDTSSMVFVLDSVAETVSNVVNVHLVTEDGEKVKKLNFTLGVDKKTVTISADPDIAIGDYVRINYNSVVPIGKMYQFKVPSKSNTDAKRVVLDAVGLSKLDKSQILMQFEFYKVAVEEGITLSFDGEKATSFEISMTVLADNTKLTDTEGSQFFRQMVLLDDVVTPISDLVATSTVSQKADISFSALTDATSINLMYKLTSGSTFSAVTVGGSSGIRMASALTDTSTSTTVLGLSGGSDYDFKVTYVIDGVNVESNVAHVTVTP